MRNHSKKLLSFILAVLVLLGSMPLALTAFAEGEIVLELNKGTLVDSTYVPTAGGVNNFHFFHHSTDSSAELNISSSNAKGGNNSAKINLKKALLTKCFF